MEQAAITQIQKTANMVEMNQALQAIPTESNLFLAPNDFHVHDLEKCMQFRTSYRFKFVTTNIDDFISYAGEYIQDGSKCFVNAEKMTAKSIFDLDTKEEAQHQNHSGNLELKRLSDYVQLLNHNEVHLSQKDAGNFIEDFADNMTCFTKDGNEIKTSLAAQSLFNLTIEQAKEIKSKVSNFGEHLSAMEKIEAKNQDQIVAGIVFSTVPYMGLKDRDFKIRVSILTGSDKPRISLKVIGLEKHQEEMSEEFRDQLINAFTDTDMKVFIGNQ